VFTTRTGAPHCFRDAPAKLADFAIGILSVAIDDRRSVGSSVGRLVEIVDRSHRSLKPRVLLSTGRGFQEPSAVRGDQTPPSPRQNQPFAACCESDCEQRRLAEVPSVDNNRFQRSHIARTQWCRVRPPGRSFAARAGFLAAACFPAPSSPSPPAPV